MSTAAVLWRAEGCVLWNRLIVLTPTLVALTLSRSAHPDQILRVACVGLVLIVAINRSPCEGALGET